MHKVSSKFAKMNCFLLLAILLLSTSYPFVQAQNENTPEEENITFQYHTIASLGDSTLGSDPSGYRGPFASVHAANLMNLDYYEGAVGGDRSWRWEKIMWLLQDCKLLQKYDFRTKESNYLFLHRKDFRLSVRNIICSKLYVVSPRTFSN